MKIDYKSISMVAFCAFALKCLILLNISFVDATCLLIASAFVGFYEYKLSLQQEKHLQNQLDEMNKKLEKQELLNKDIIGSISSVKNSIAMKSTNPRANY